MEFAMGSPKVKHRPKSLNLQSWSGPVVGHPYRGRGTGGFGKLSPDGSK
jgi:hypothetical protein